jgi:hypothetical protein
VSEYWESPALLAKIAGFFAPMPRYDLRNQVNDGVF